VPSARGFDRADLEHKFPHLAEWETEATQPTLKQVEAFAKATTRRWFFFFFKSRRWRKSRFLTSGRLTTSASATRPRLAGHDLCLSATAGVVSELRALDGRIAAGFCGFGAGG